MRRAGILTLLVAIGIAAAGCAPSPHGVPDPTPAGAAFTETGVVYREVDDVRLALDACLPADADRPSPAVILLHGGGFVEGTRSSSGMSELCTWFASHGFAAFPVSYRLVPEFVYPDQVEDVAAAVAFLRANADRFAIDPDRIGALGSSAGAIIALQAATLGEGPLDAGSRLGAVVSLSGVADMSAAAAQSGTPSEEAIALMLAYLGCTSIASCDGAAASPVSNLDPTDPPLLLVTSKHDLVPVEQAEAMAAALDEQGVEHELIVLLGNGHGAQLLTARVEAAILAFLESTL